jgi:hypothetical protein
MLLRSVESVPLVTVSERYSNHGLIGVRGSAVPYHRYDQLAPTGGPPVSELRSDRCEGNQ